MSRIFDRRKIIKRLKKEGWKLSKKQGKGSHEWYEKDGNTTIVPRDGKTLPKGTVGSIERKTGIKF